MEYRAIMLVSDFTVLDSNNASDLNQWFDKGWEFVESIEQPLASGSSSICRGAVLVILKRNKIEKGVKLS